MPSDGAVIDHWAGLLAGPRATDAAQQWLAEALGAAYDAGYTDGVRGAIGGIVLDVLPDGTPRRARFGAGH